MSLPFMGKRMEPKLLLENDENINPTLLNTILVPKDLHYLTDKLPVANYEPIKTRMSNNLDYVAKRSSNADNSHADGSGNEFLIEKNSHGKLPGILQGIQGINSNHGPSNPRIGSSHNKNAGVGIHQINSLSRSPQPNHQMIRDNKEIYNKKPNYKLESNLKKYDAILHINKQQKKQPPGNKQNDILNDYMKIYGVGLSGPGANNANPPKNKYSSNNLKMKLEPIKHPGLNLPKLIGSGPNKDRSPDRGNRLPKIG
jgi:hypothetical protein